MGTNEDNGQTRRTTSPFDHLVNYEGVSTAQFASPYRSFVARGGATTSSYDFQYFQEYTGIPEHVADEQLGGVTGALSASSEQLIGTRRPPLDCDVTVQTITRNLDASAGTTYTLQLNNLMDYSVQGDGGEFDQLPDIDPSDVLPDFGVIQSSSTSDGLPEPTMGISVSPSRDIGRSDQSHFSLKSQESSNSRHEILSLGANLINFTDDASFGYSVSSVEESQAEVTSLPEGALCLPLQEGETIPVSLEDFISPSAFTVASSSSNESHPSLSSLTETIKFAKLLSAPDNGIPSRNDLAVVTSEGLSCSVVTPVIQAVASLKKQDMSLKVGKSERGLVPGHESSLPVPQIITKPGQLNQCGRIQSNGASSVKKTQVVPCLQSSMLYVTSAATQLYTTTTTSNAAPLRATNLSPGISKDSSSKILPASKAALTAPNPSIFPNSNHLVVKNKSVSLEDPKIFINASLSHNIVSNKQTENNGQMHYKTLKCHDFTKPSSLDAKGTPGPSDKNCRNGFQSAPLKANLSAPRNGVQSVGRMNLRSATLSSNVCSPTSTDFVVYQNQSASSIARLEVPSSMTVNVNVNSTHHDSRHVSGVERMKEVGSVNKPNSKGLESRQLMDFSTSLSSTTSFQQSPVAVSSSPLGIINNTTVDLRETLSSSPALCHQNNEINLLGDTDEILPNIQFSTSLEEEFGDPHSILTDNLEEESAGSLQDLQGLSTSLAAPDIFTANGIRTSFIRNLSTTQSLPHCSSSSEMTLTFPSAFLDNSNMSIDISNLSDDDISASNSNLIDDLDKTYSPRKSSLLHSDLSFSQMLSAIDKKEDENFKSGVSATKIPTVISQDVNLATSSHREEDNLGTLLKQNHHIKEQSHSSLQSPVKTTKTVVKRTKDPHQSSDMLFHQVYYRCRTCMLLSTDEKVILAHMKNDHPNNHFDVDDPELDDTCHKPEKLKVFLPRTSSAKSTLKNLPKYAFPGIMTSTPTSTTHPNHSKNIFPGLTLTQSRSDADLKTVRELGLLTPKLSTAVQPAKMKNTVQTPKITTAVQPSNMNSCVQTSKIASSVSPSMACVEAPKKISTVAPTLSKLSTTYIQSPKITTHTPTPKVDASVIMSSSSVSSILVPSSPALRSDNKTEKFSSSCEATVISSVKDINSKPKVEPQSPLRFVREPQVKTNRQSTTLDFEETSSSKETSVIANGNLKKRERKPAPKSGRPFAAKSIGLAKVRKRSRTADDSEEKRFGFRCDIGGCGLRLSTLEKVEYHRRCHPQVSQNSYDDEAQAVKVGLECPECPKAVQQWRLLATHLWRAHCIDIDMHKCPQCEFRCYSASRLMRSHMPSHSDVRPYLCEACGRVFKTYKQLAAHKTSHHSTIPLDAQEKFTCNICNKNFGDKRMLLNHVDVLHKKVRPHLCCHCGKAFGSKNTLVIHLRTHTGEKPFLCDNCEYRTSDHNSLRRHKMQHSQDKRYKCSLCTYSSIQSTSYKVHLAEKHFQKAVALGLLFACENCKFKTVKRDMYRSHLANQHQITLPPDPPPHPTQVDIHTSFLASKTVTTGTTTATVARQNATATAVSASNSVQDSKMGIITTHADLTKEEQSSGELMNERRNSVRKINAEFDTPIFVGNNQKSVPSGTALSAKRRTIVMEDVEFKRINSMDIDMEGISDLKAKDVDHGAPHKLMSEAEVSRNSNIIAINTDKILSKPTAQQLENNRKKVEPISAQDKIETFGSVQNGLVLKSTDFHKQMNVVIPTRENDSVPQVPHMKQAKANQQFVLPSKSVGNLGLQSTTVYVQNLISNAGHMAGPELSYVSDPNSTSNPQNLNSTSSVLSQGIESSDETAPLIIGRIEVDSSGNLVLISDGNLEKANLNGTAVVLPPNLVSLVVKPTAVEASEETLKQPVAGSANVHMNGKLCFSSPAVIPGQAPKVHQAASTHTNDLSHTSKSITSNSIKDRASVLKIGTFSMPKSELRQASVIPNRIPNSTSQGCVVAEHKPSTPTSATIEVSEADSAIVLNSRSKRASRKRSNANTRLNASPSSVSISPQEMKNDPTFLQGNLLSWTKPNSLVDVMDDKGSPAIFTTLKKVSSESVCGVTALSGKQFTANPGESGSSSAKLESSSACRQSSRIMYSVIPTRLELQHPQRTPTAQSLHPQSGIQVAHPQKMVLQQLPQSSLHEKQALTLMRQQQSSRNGKEQQTSHNSLQHHEFSTSQPHQQPHCISGHEEQSSPAVKQQQSSLAVKQQQSSPAVKRQQQQSSSAMKQQFSPAMQQQPQQLQALLRHPQVVVRPTILQHRPQHPMHLEQQNQLRFLQPLTTVQQQRLSQPVIQIRLQEPAQQLVQRLQLSQLQEVTVPESIDWSTGSNLRGVTRDGGSTTATSVTLSVLSATTPTTQGLVSETASTSVTLALTPSKNGVIPATASAGGGLACKDFQGNVPSKSGSSIVVAGDRSVSIAGANSDVTRRGNDDVRGSGIGGSWKNSRVSASDTRKSGVKGNLKRKRDIVEIGDVSARGLGDRKNAVGNATGNEISAMATGCDARVPSKSTASLQPGTIFFSEAPIGSIRIHEAQPQRK